MPSIGQQIIDYIISAGLVHTDQKVPNLLVWSANAPEQLTQFVETHVPVHGERCNVCGCSLRTPDEEAMGMCKHCAYD